MKEQLRKTIELLRHHVQKNLETIHHNERKVREILKEPVTSQRSERLTEKYNTNKDILRENNEFIKLQLSIVRVLDKYKYSLDYSVSDTEQPRVDYKTVESGNEKRPEKSVSQPDTKEELRNQYLAKFSREDYMELTATEMVPFDKNHPYYEDQVFIKELFERFIESENYEMCARLSKFKK
jgi:hypothetical protein